MGNHFYNIIYTLLGFIFLSCPTHERLTMFFRLCLCVVLVAMATAASIADGQTGCLFDGRVYQPGDVITIGGCLARMTCLGNNLYSDMEQLGGICPDSTTPPARTKSARFTCHLTCHICIFT